jgi:hypothetical protein
MTGLVIKKRTEEKNGGVTVGARLSSLQFQSPWQQGTVSNAS